jgi:hypothetical protein
MGSKASAAPDGDVAEVGAEASVDGLGPDRW